MHTYTANDIRHVDGQFEIDTGDRIIAGTSPDAVLRIANQIEQSRANTQHFLEAWQDAVRLVGTDLFNINTESVEAATDKNQLTPNFEAVTRALGVMSGGERRFLIALYQFYNDRDILEYCREQEITTPSMSDLAILDDEHLSILTRLLHSYTGW